MLGFEVHGHSTAVEIGASSFEEDVVVGVRLQIRYESDQHAEWMHCGSALDGRTSEWNLGT
jgi:hypothetical protein